MELFKDPHRVGEVVRQGRFRVSRESVPSPIRLYKDATLPSDFIRMLRLNGRDIKDVTDPYEIEYSKGAGAQVLLTDATTAKIQYIAEITDTTQYDDLLIEALAVRLASKLATILRQDEAKASALLQEYMQVSLPRARKVDGNERQRSPYNPREQSLSINSRRFGTLQGSLDADAV
jgi:hypothetical protein